MITVYTNGARCNINLPWGGFGDMTEVGRTVMEEDINSFLEEVAEAALPGHKVTERCRTVSHLADGSFSVSVSLEVEGVIDPIKATEIGECVYLLLTECYSVALREASARLIARAEGSSPVFARLFH